MPAKSTRKQISCRYFHWRIWQNSFAIWQADGRSNPINVGRHTLDTKAEGEAIITLHDLDAVMAVKHGLADEAILADDGKRLTLGAGVQAYLDHVKRSRITGGAKPRTVQRYKAVFDKFMTFSSERGVQTWEEVSTRALENYSSWLEEQDYKYRTLYLELTTLKQTLKWLREERLVRSSDPIRLNLTKPSRESGTYCYTEQEVQAILRYCACHEDLRWLGELLYVLAYTGMRVGEATQIRWEDIDLHGDMGFIHVRDESRGSKVVDAKNVRSTKTGRGRTIPMHRCLYALFEKKSDSAKGPVFHGPKGGRAKPDTIRNVFIRNVITPLGLKLHPHDPGHRFRDGRLHSFRHYFCTQSYKAGMSERVILDLMGHASSNITQLYRHMAPDAYGDAINRLPDFDTEATPEE